MTGSALTRREAAAWNALVDALLQPHQGLPPAEGTAAADNLGAWLTAAPAPNRAVIRALIRAAGALGPRRAARRLERVRRGPLPAVGDLLRTLAATTYYADEAVLRTLDHDPDAVLRRARDLRAREGRP